MGFYYYSNKLKVNYGEQVMTFAEIDVINENSHCQSLFAR